MTFATYLLAGIAGAPIFAPSATSANHGIDRIVGATGGYLVGMLVASFVLGYLADRKADQKFRTSFPALLLGDLIIFTLGLTWLHASLDLTWAATFKQGSHHLFSVKCSRLPSLQHHYRLYGEEFHAASIAKCLPSSPSPQLALVITFRF